jgi:hypothetical protein
MKGLNKGIFVELQKGYEENSGKTAMRQEKDWVPFSRILSSPLQLLQPGPHCQTLSTLSLKLAPRIIFLVKLNI